MKKKDLFSRECRNKGDFVRFVRRLNSFNLQFFLHPVQCNVRLFCLWGIYGKKREVIFTALFFDG